MSSDTQDLKGCGTAEPPHSTLVLVGVGMIVPGGWRTATQTCLAAPKLVFLVLGRDNASLVTQDLWARRPSNKSDS